MSKKKFSLVLFVLALVLVLSGTSVFAAGAEEASPTAPTACTGPIHTGFAVQSHPYDVTRTPAGYAPRTDAHIYVGSTGGAGNDFRALMPFPRPRIRRTRVECRQVPVSYTPNCASLSMPSAANRARLWPVRLIGPRAA